MVVGFIRIVLVAIGAAGGLEFMREYSSYWQNDELGYFSAIVVAVFILSGLGYVLGGVVGRWIEKLVVKAETSIQRYSVSDMILGFIGLVLGLGIAALVSLSIRGIELIGVYLPPLIFIVFGYLGLRVMIRKRTEFESKLSFLTEQKVGRDGIGDMTVGPKFVDTSIVIDGRLGDVARSGFLDGQVVVPTFVLQELQRLADSRDSAKREKGRRGLDILKELQADTSISVDVLEEELTSAGVDAQLVAVAKEFEGSIITKDFNLQKVAEVAGVKVLSINDLTNAVKSVISSGERIEVDIKEKGKEPGQGIGYLGDGTMIIINEGGTHIGEKATVEITNVLQTSAGRLLFSKLVDPASESAG